MARMLGAATRTSRQDDRWWYCCSGHDGLWKHYIHGNRKGQRAREKHSWKQEIW